MMYNDVKSLVAIIYQWVGATLKQVLFIAAAQEKPLQPWKWSKPRLGTEAKSMVNDGKIYQQNSWI